MNALARTSPPSYDPITPSRLVELSPVLRCPVCHRSPNLSLDEGRLWLRCEVRSCRVWWLALALPPGAHGFDLEPMLGRDAVVRLLRPLVDAANPLLAVLAPPRAPAFLQFRVTPHEHRAHRHRPIGALLAALGAL